MSVTFISHSAAREFYSDKNKYGIFITNMDDEEDEIWGAVETQEEAIEVSKRYTEDYGDVPEFQFYYKESKHE